MGNTFTLQKPFSYNKVISWKRNLLLTWYLIASSAGPSPPFFKLCFINAIPRRISTCYRNCFVQFIHLPIKKKASSVAYRNRIQLNTKTHAKHVANLAAWKINDQFFYWEFILLLMKSFCRYKEQSEKYVS